MRKNGQASVVPVEGRVGDSRNEGVARHTQKVTVSFREREREGRDASEGEMRVIGRTVGQITIHKDHNYRDNSPIDVCACHVVSSFGRRGVEERNINTNKLNTQTIGYDSSGHGM